MTLTIISSTPHFLSNGKYYAYGPYVREINLWRNYVSKLIVVAPLSQNLTLSDIHQAYNKEIELIEVPAFNIINLNNLLRTLIVSPRILLGLVRGMNAADHLHLRCPCNLSVFGLFVQSFYPKLKKSAKYAGNWDPKSEQPWSYRLQQSILRNTFLTRNMQVLVYGDWPNEPRHVQPFISATYYDKDKVPFKTRDYSRTLEFVFAASLVNGKRPLLTVQIIEALNARGIPAILHMFGDGPLRPELESYIRENGIQDQISLYGNRDIQELKSYYERAHFNILPSKSEGWPKAVAEGMFFGCVPVTTDVSCVAWMLDDGRRGILIEPELDDVIHKLIKTLEGKQLNLMAKAAYDWSVQYTFDKLENEIKLILT